MNYHEMVKEAQVTGKFTEKQMWESVESVSALLDEIKDTHRELYWAFMREQHGIMSGGHYNEKFAIHDVGDIMYTNRKGEKKQGAYWTVEQVEDATKGIAFPAGVNKWDKWVAANMAHSDFCKKFDDEQILEIMYSFFFADEDWSDKGSSTKVWDYACCKYGKYNK